MGIRPDRGCKPYGSCARPSMCDIPSSKIYYDGENIDEAGVYHGMPLNEAIANLGQYVARAVKISGSVRVENFQGISNVRLSTDAEEVLQVSYCGGVLPKGAYKLQGRNVVFCKDICFDDEMASVQVIYREKASTSYGFRC